MVDALPPAPGEPANPQDRAQFSSEAAAIAAQRRTVEWVVPSRSEGRSVPAAEAELMVYGEPIEQEIDVVGTPQVTDETSIQGGRERGLVLHKLMEEILTGEVGDADHDLVARAEALVRELGIEPTEVAEMGLSPTELASTVRRTLELSDVAALRERLVPECCVYSSTIADTSEQVVSGIADALSMEPDGSVAVVLDWKSDIDPQPETIDHYRQQIAAYQRATGAKRGLIVFMTSGKVIEIAAPA
jgi:ATP-dependent exoDNAse (exonuclease V) beta subunit